MMLIIHTIMLTGCSDEKWYMLVPENDLEQAMTPPGRLPVDNSLSSSNESLSDPFSSNTELTFNGSVYYIRKVPPTRKEKIICGLTRTGIGLGATALFGVGSYFLITYLMNLGAEVSSINIEVSGIKALLTNLTQHCLSLPKL